jgi:hypothetical protein
METWTKMILEASSRACKMDRKQHGINMETTWKQHWWRVGELVHKGRENGWLVMVWWHFIILSCYYIYQKG